MDLEPIEYFNSLGFSEWKNFVFQDDFLIGIKGTDGSELLADRFIKGLDFDEVQNKSKDFTIASYFSENLLLWEVDWLIVDKPFVIHRDQYPSVKEKLQELKTLPIRKFWNYWNENAF